MKKESNLFSLLASYAPNNAPVVLHTPLVWLSNRSMGDFTPCCSVSLTQYIIGHWASLRLEVKSPWIGTEIWPLAPSLPSSTCLAQTLQLIIAIPLLAAFSAYYGPV